MGRPPCYYCSQVRTHARGYSVRPALHGLDTDAPRCDLHWRFKCDRCGRTRHYHGMSFCGREGKFFCLSCARSQRAPRARFWGWTYYFRFGCPWHRESHPALDRLEFEGRHPWQVRPAWRRARRGMSTDEVIPEWWAFRVAALHSVDDADVRKGWDDVAAWWVSRYTEKGDINREWVVDPVLFRWLGDVRGKRILDAGCGGGYLSRILAKKGARVVGVDHSSKLIEQARAAPGGKGLGIRYVQGNLANLSVLPSRSFDLAVSNIVLQDVRRIGPAVREVHRVLRRGGRFLFSITHPAFEAPVPGRWVRVAPDQERDEERRHMAVDRYFDRVAVWWGPPGKPGAVGFHRPLRDYFEALSDAGFLVSRFEEPLPLKRAHVVYPRWFADMLRIPNFLVVEAVRPD